MRGRSFLCGECSCTGALGPGALGPGALGPGVEGKDRWLCCVDIDVGAVDDAPLTKSGLRKNPRPNGGVVSPLGGLQGTRAFFPMP
jgi:hypothetical protein